MEDENENDTEMDNSSQIYSSSLDSSLRFSSKTSHRNSIFISSPTPSRKKFPTFKKKNYQSTIIVDQSEWNSMDPSKKIKLEKIFGVEVSPSKTSPKLQTVNVTDNNGNINTENSSLLNFSSSGPSHVIPHCFQASINSKFNNNLCHFCKEIVFIFGYQCLDCGYVIHQKCLSKVSESCKMTTDLMFWTYSEKSKWTYIDLPEDFNGVEIIQTHSEELAIILNENGEGLELILLKSGRFKTTPLPETLKNRKIKQVSGGASHTIFLTSSGDVFTYGKNTEGQLGLGLDENVEVTTPTLVESLLNDPVRAISSGGNHCIVITKSNKIYVWGTGRNGRLGTGNSDHKFSPYVLTFLLPKKNSNFIVNDVCCGWSHTLVYFKPEIPTEKESLSYIFAFGKADMGQCGICASDSQYEPKLIEELIPLDIVSLKAGYYHSVCLTSKGIVYCFGLNREGQCGQGIDTQNQQIPKPLSGLFQPVSSIYCGGFHSVCITKFGECFIWGRTGNKNHFLPTSIKQLSNKKVLSVTCTLYYTAAFVVQPHGNIKGKKKKNKNKKLESEKLRPESKSVTPNQYDLLSLIYIKKVQEFFNSSNAQIQNELSIKLNSIQTHKLKQQTLNLTVLKIKKYKEKLEKNRKFLEEERKKKEELKRHCEQRKNFLEKSVKILENSKLQLEKKEQILKQTKDLVFQYQSRIEKKRGSLITTLGDIFPIEETQNLKELMICGIVLPNLNGLKEESNFKDPYHTYDKESIAAALGYVSQLLVTISNLIQVPLIYRVHPFGSRSYIVDCISKPEDQILVYPLYPAYNKIEMFLQGIIMLNKNIKQLIKHLYVNPIYSSSNNFDKSMAVKLGETLPNILLLLDYFGSKRRTLRSATIC